MVSLEAVAGRLEVATQFAMIIDFAVEDHPYLIVLVGHGLMPGLQVDNRQPAKSQRDVGCQMEAIIVRTPMNDARRHTPNAAFGIATASKMQNAGYSTHLEQHPT